MTMEIKENIRMRYIRPLLFCCMVVGYFYFGYVDFIGPLSLGVVSVIALFSIYCLSCCIRLNGKFSIGYMRSSGMFSSPHVAITIFLVLMVLWAVILGRDSYIQLVRQFFLPILLIFSVKEAIRSVRQTDLALRFIAFIVSVSCIVSVFQAMNIDFFWELRTMIAEPKHKAIIYQFAKRLRAPGLALYSISLSYQIVSIFPFIFFLYYLARKSFVRKKIIMFGFCLSCGAVAIQSISAVVALIIGCITFAKLSRLISLKKLIGMFIIVSIIIMGISSFNHFSKRFTKADIPTLARLPLTITGARIVLVSPLGATGEKLRNLKREYYEDVAFMPGSSFILNTSSHNCLINAGMKYGWVFFIGYIWLYFYLFKLVIKARRRSDKSTADYYFFSSAFVFLVVYFWQGFVHNAGLPSGEPVGWLMVGIILSYRPSQIDSSKLRENYEISSIA